MPYAQETTNIEESDLSEQPQTMTVRDDGPGARAEDGLDRAGKTTSLAVGVETRDADGGAGGF